MCILETSVDSASVNNTGTQFLRDPDEITSSNNNFKLGFFSPPNSTNRYVGIWYNTGSDALDVVWVANRDNPLKDSSGVLTASEDGDLQVLDGQNKVLWSSNSTHLLAMTNSSVLQLLLLDTGNLVMSSDKGGGLIWMSFDHPTDSFLPDMRIGIYDDTNNRGHVLRSWKSPSDPSSGRFTTGMTPSRTLLEVFIWDEDGRPYWRSGPWNGNFFIGVPMTYNWGLINSFRVTNGSLLYSPETTGVVDHFVLTHDGILVQKVPDNNTHQSEITWSSLESECDVYGKCGPFGKCNPQDSPICSCLEGFEPRNNKEWSNGNWTSGCVRRIHLQCGNADAFLRLQNVKVPDYAEPSSSLDGEENCRRECQAQCLCLAYAYHLAIGCMTWNRTLIDIQQFNTTALDLFVRLANSEPAVWSRIDRAGKQRWKTIVAVAVITGTIAFVIVGFFLWRWANPLCGKGTKGKDMLMHSITSDFNVSDVQFKDLPLFKLEKLAIATNNFHMSNKLGQGGFGPVFKGKLGDGQEIAVKRLSSASGQGLQEFMNEVLLISKLQHRNLVRLLGCCVEDEEKMLVYEYMPNKGLDALLFDPLHGELLPWRKRFDIIEGICRGLLYLHRDSRLRIIHRDLKASNILLDEDLNPKISDFGMAKIYGGKDELGNTSRIVGTYGYICPEYAMEGRCSEKSDVYSFGVLLLEIISGRRNNSFKANDESLSLLAYVWKLWNEDDILALIDPIIGDACHQKEISKCIQIGLLCVQEFSEDRPTISAVISMLESEISYLPRPTQPGFTLRRNCIPHQATSKDVPNCSVYNVTVSSLSGR